MTPERYRLVQQIFEQVCDLDHGERSVVMERACRGDATLQREVGALLAHDDGDPDTDARSDPRFAIGAPCSATPALTSMPERIGRYRIIRFVGAGGMGMVFQAEQDEPQRTVALKLLNPGLVTAETVKRFRREVHVLGLLHHPGIAQVYDAGSADPGDGPRAFFVMEFVEGEPILDWIRRRKIGVRERLELVARLCDAVQHAHTKGVVHRDLKPGNILVTGEGQPKILDFGVARLRHPELRATTLRTEVGQLIGTIPYMSPEQTSGDPDEIDTRCDVYALGLLLYESLVDRPPYDLSDRALAEALRIIREETPRPLSTIDRSLRGDVETIVATALAKDKTRRYQTASSLADDIRRHLRDEPISVRPPSALYQISKLVRRHRVPCALACALLLVSIAFGVIGTVQAHNLREANTRAEREAEEKDHQLYCSQIAQANMLYSDRNLEQLDAVLDACDPGRRGWEWRWLKGKARPAGITVLDGSKPVVGVVPVDGDLLVLRGREFEVRSLARDQVLFHLELENGRTSAISFSQDARWIAVGHGDGSVRLLRATSGECVGAVSIGDGPVGTARFGALGQIMVATGGGLSLAGESVAGVESTRAFLFDVATQKLIADYAIEGFAFATAVDEIVAMLFAMGSITGLLRVWRVGESDPIWEHNVEGAISSVALSRAGTQLFYGVNGRLGAIDIQSGNGRLLSGRHQGNITSIAVNEAWGEVSSIASDGIVVRDIDSGAELLRQAAHRHKACGLVLLPDSPWVCSWSFDGKVRIWSTVAASSDEWVNVLAQGPSASFDIAAGVIGAVTEDGDDIVLSRAVDGGRVACLEGAGGRVTAVALSDRAIVTGSENGTIVLWDREAQAMRRDLFEHSSAVLAVARHDRFVVSGAAEELAITSTDNGESVRASFDSSSRLVALASASGVVVSAHSDGSIRRWQIPSLECSDVGIQEGVGLVALSADGQHVAAATPRGEIRLWHHGGEAKTVDNGGRVTAIAWSSDGERLFSGGRDATVRVWDHDGVALLALKVVGETVHQLWHAADDSLIVRYHQGQLRHWRTAPMSTPPSELGGVLSWQGSPRHRDEVPWPDGGGAFWGTYDTDE